MARAFVAALFAMLAAGSFADETMQALAADGEAAALNLLQHKGSSQAEEEMMNAQTAVDMSTPGTAFLEEAEGRFRCGVIYCADARGNFCCSQSRSSVCCGPGARCHNGGGLAMCL